MFCISSQCGFVCDVSSPLHSPGRLKILFNIIEQQAGNGRHCGRRGVCTGWLSGLTSPILLTYNLLEDSLEKLSLTDKPISVCRYLCMTFLTVRSGDVTRFCGCFVVFHSFIYHYNCPVFHVHLFVFFVVYCHFGWSAWLSGRTPVSGQHSFAVLRSTCS